MKELQITGNILLIIVAATLIAFAVKDMFLTAKHCLNIPTRWQTSDESLVNFFVSVFRKSKWRIKIQQNLYIFVPMLQIVIWKNSLIAGFAFLYLVFGWQYETDIISNDRTNDFSAAFWLSLMISFRLAIYELPLDNSAIIALANMQFYLGFVFFGFVGFYILKLRQKAKLLKPRLFNLQYQVLNNSYSPFALADSLRQYADNNLMLILQDWNKWAEELKVNLRQHRYFIYGGISYEKNIDWLFSLKIILDVSAALIITSDGKIERNARKIFESARKTLIETADLIAKNCLESKIDGQKKINDDSDQILSSEVVFDKDELDIPLFQSEMLNVWRFTYEKDLRALAKAVEYK